MTIKKYTIDEGSLVLGEAGSTLEIAAQVRDAAVDFDEEAGDDRPTLSGEVLRGKVTNPATLSGTVLQDLSDDGIVDYTWANRGKVVPFSFTPSSAEAKTITGECRIKPLKVGGEAGEDGPESEFEWVCIGDPVLGASLV